MLELISKVEFGISELFSCLALAISILSVVSTWKNHQMQTELQIYQMVCEEKKNYSSTILKLHMAQNEGQSMNSDLAVDIVTENLCNAYDVFCGNYIDKHISRKRFRRIYAKEVLNWVEIAEKNGLYDGQQKEYQDTFTVYQKLKNLKVK